MEFGSIFLFINGFRIPPYGEYGNDWLGLDIRSKQRYASLFGTRDVLGRIEINDHENIFPIVSNREGIVKNKSYNQLVGAERLEFKESYIYSIFRKLELFVVKGLDWDRIKDKTYVKQYETGKIEYDPSRELFNKTYHERNFMILNEVKRIIGITTKKQNIIKLIININIIDKIADEEIEKINKIIKDVETYDTKLDTKTSTGISKIKSTLKALSQKIREEEDKRKEAETELKQTVTENLFLKSTSLQDKDQITSLFHHIGIHSDTIKSQAGNLLKSISEQKNIPEKINKQVERIVKQSQIINTISKIGYKGGITEEMEDEKQDIIIFMVEFIKNICADYYVNIDIKVDNSIKSEFIKEFKPFEVTYVIDNFISNAKKQNASEIIFKCYKKDGNAIVEVIDNGNGLDSKIKDIKDIFKRNVSTTRGGAGLGLYDAKKIISKFKGKIEAENLEKGFKLKMVIPK